MSSEQAALQLAQAAKKEGRTLQQTVWALQQSWLRAEG